MNQSPEEYNFEPFIPPLCETSVSSFFFHIVNRHNVQEYPVGALMSALGHIRYCSSLHKKNGESYVRELAADPEDVNYLNELLEFTKARIEAGET